MMRLLCEIFIIGGLLYLGWEKPFRDRLPSSVNPAPPPKTVTVQPAPVPYSTPAPQSGTWMQDPNRHTPLDTPAPAVAHHQPQPSASGPAGWMFDPNHHSPLDPPKKSSTPH
jgi:hypothetical protein